MRDDIDYTWFQHDINIVRKILQERKYRDAYIEILIKKLIEMFERSSLPEITVPMVRNAFIYDLGRSESERIANYFEQVKSTGKYEHELITYAKKMGYLD